MRNSKLQKLPLGDIIPQGWIRNQLEVQADGLTGNVMELFDDLSIKSAWLGGKGESWERGPYYVDGLMPLAYLLDDDKLKGITKLWIDNIFNSQTEAGFFGPKGNLDWWPRMVVTKMLTSYYEATKDERVIPFLKKYYTYMNNNIDERPLYSWANARGIEELIGVDWLYIKTKESFLLELGNKIIAQSLDWGKEFEDFPYISPTDEYMSSARFNVKKVAFYAVDFINNMNQKSKMNKEKMLERNNDSFNKFYHLTHGVNIAMALKYPALIGCFKNNLSLAIQSKKGYDTIMNYHGTANGLYTCDEHLSGAIPTQGTELCTVAEAMFSAEKLYECTDDDKWADLIELLAFNTFPATFTSDMCSHQYVQQANQISATTAKRNWYDAYNKANIYGLKPNYACCLANMHQGFPKFCEHLAYLDNDILVLLCPLPMKIDTLIGGENVSIEVISDYPFKDTARVKIKKGMPIIRFRIPKNANSLTINGKVHTGSSVVIEAIEGKDLILKYDFKLIEKRNKDGSVSFYYGNLLLALPINRSIKFKNASDRFSDREMKPVSNWNYTPISKDGYKIVENKISKEPFSTYPLEIVFKGIQVPSWIEKGNQADLVPTKFLKGQEAMINLVPYGMTDLRISHFPRV
jgi:hypothetical protein